MSTEGRHKAERLPVACELSAKDQSSRREETVHGLFGGCKDVRELEHGYEFVFPGDEEWVLALARFIASERKCCRFFTFELLFEPDLGMVSLRVWGPEGTKGFLASQFTREFAKEHSLNLD